MNKEIFEGKTLPGEFFRGGPACEPPVNKLLAGFDPVAIDAAGGGLLGIPWRQVGCLKMADGVLGGKDYAVRKGALT